MTKIVPMGVEECGNQEYDIEHEANKTDTVNISVLAASSPFPQNLNRNASLPHQVWAKLTAKKPTSLTQILMAKEKKFPCLIAPDSKKKNKI